MYLIYPPSQVVCLMLFFNRLGQIGSFSLKTREIHVDFHSGFIHAKKKQNDMWLKKPWNREANSFQSLPRSELSLKKNRLQEECALMR